MSIKDINKEIYEDHSQIITEREQLKSPYNPGESVDVDASPFAKNEHWKSPKKKMDPQQKKLYSIIAGIVVFITLSVGGYFSYNLWNKSAFHQDRVVLDISGPHAADSMQPTQYVIHYQNNNRVTLKNVEISLNYTENFEPTNNVNLKQLSSTKSVFTVDDIKPNSEGSVLLTGIFLAPKDLPVYMHASMQYVPSNLSEKKQTENQVGVVITSEPVELTVTAPRDAVDGDSVAYVIGYRNQNERTVTDLKLHVSYPEGFEFGDSSPAPADGNSIWNIGSLEQSQSGEVVIRGRLKGIASQARVLVAEIGRNSGSGEFMAFNHVEEQTRIMLPVLTIKQQVDNANGGLVDPGQALHYTVNFQNTGATLLRDAIITVEIKGRVLDFSKLEIEKGSYDAKKGTLTWKASDVPELKNIEPQGKGTVGFAIPVLSFIPVNSAQDKNYTITTVAKIDSNDIKTPIGANKVVGSDTLQFKLNTKVLVNTTGYFNDSKINNSGTMPMQVGKETTLTLHWLLTNISNDVSGAKIVASLPSGVRFTGKIDPKDENISYNNRSNEVVWDVGTLSAGVGVIEPKREVVFQVAVTPQVNQVGKVTTLLNEAIFTGKDTFTGKDISITQEPKTSKLAEDESLNYDAYLVAK